MLLRWTIWLHKWLALIIGAQIVFWIVGGIVMVVLPIEKVRGEHRVGHPPPVTMDVHAMLTPEQVIARAELDEIIETDLKVAPRGPLWTLRTSYGREQSFDARTGDPIEEISEADARKFATLGYEGPGKVVNAVYFDDPPQRSGANDPVWAVTFDDPEKSVLYLSSLTGEVQSRRSAVWDAYDLAWKFHIMNFKDGDNYNTPILFFASLLAVIVTFSGVVLLWIRIGRDLKGWAAARKDDR